MLIPLLPIAYAQPSWAQKGNWAEYVIEGYLKAPTLEGGTEEVQYKASVRVTITRVDSSGFEVESQVLNVEVHPEKYKSEIESQMRSTESQYFYFDNRFSSCELYVSPKTLPSNGVYEGMQSGVEYRCAYDTSTGWLKEAHMRASNMGMEFRQSIKMVNSNLGAGGFGMLSLGLPIPPWLLILIIVIVIGVIIGVVVALKKRKSYQPPAVPSPAPSPPTTPSTSP